MSDLRPVGSEEEEQDEGQKGTGEEADPATRCIHLRTPALASLSVRMRLDDSLKRLT